MIYNDIPSVIHRDLANNKWDIYGKYMEIASGKRLQFAIENGHRNSGLSIYEYN